MRGDILTHCSPFRWIRQFSTRRDSGRIEPFPPLYAWHMAERVSRSRGCAACTFGDQPRRRLPQRQPEAYHSASVHPAILSPSDEAQDSDRKRALQFHIAGRNPRFFRTIPSCIHLPPHFHHGGLSSPSLPAGDIRDSTLSVSIWAASTVRTSCVKHLKRERSPVFSPCTPLIMERR